MTKTLLTRHSTSLLATVGIILLAAPAAAQDGTARVSGVIRTQGGAPLGAVAVSFESEDGAPFTGETDADGRFTVSVPSGRAGTLRFRHPAHLPAHRLIRALQEGAGLEIALTLAPIYRLDALSVVSGRNRPLLNTDDAETGGAIDPYELRALPTESRRPLDLAFNIPGVSQATGFFGDAPPLTIHGENALYTQYTIDGLDNNEGFLGGPRVQFPLAGLERLKVHAATYRPGLGRTTNGVVDVETRSGRGEWEGEVFLVNRPGTPFDADPKFSPVGVDPDGFERTQIGGAIGGPLITDQTFLFATVEYSNESEDRIGSTARADFVGTEKRETWKAFTRLDHGWSDSQTTTLRLAFSDLRRKGQGGGDVVPEADITTRRIGSISNLTHRSALGGGYASNEFSVQIGTFTWDFPPTASDLETPRVIIKAPDGSTEAVVGSSSFVFDESELQLQLKEVFEARLGERHTLRVGADVLTSSFELTGANTNPMGVYEVLNEANITPSGPFLSIDDIPADVRVLSYTVDANPQQVDLTQTLWSAFVEDRWRITPALTVQAGVRWDYDDLTSRGESEADLNNFQPRASFNWYATPTTVVRGGWGIHTGKFPYAVFSDAVQFGPEGNATVTFEEGTDSPPPEFLRGATPEQIRALEGALPPREVRRTFANGLEQPNSSQLSLGVQRQIGRSWSVAVDGVWIETRNLPRSFDLNAIDRPLTPADTIDRSPSFGDPFRPTDPATSGFRRLTTTDSGGRGRYLGLSTTVRRALEGGLALEGSWTWSRAENDTEDINFQASQGNDFDAEWADAINDRRHQVTARGIWEAAKSLELAAIVDWQTGTPVNWIAFERDLDGSGGIFGNGFIGNHDRFPGVARNTDRLPHAWQVNATATYDLGVGPNRLRLRAEAFNILNRTNYTGFVNGVAGGGPRTQRGRPGDPLEFTSAAPPRQLQFSAQWVF